MHTTVRAPAHPAVGLCAKDINPKLFREASFLMQGGWGELLIMLICNRKVVRKNNFRVWHTLHQKTKQRDQSWGCQAGLGKNTTGLLLLPLSAGRYAGTVAEKGVTLLPIATAHLHTQLTQPPYGLQICSNISSHQKETSSLNQARSLPDSHLLSPEGVTCRICLNIFSINEKAINSPFWHW